MLVSYFSPCGTSNLVLIASYLTDSLHITNLHAIRAQSVFNFKQIVSIAGSSRCGFFAIEVQVPLAPAHCPPRPALGQRPPEGNEHLNTVTVFANRGWGIGGKSR